MSEQSDALRLADLLQTKHIKQIEPQDLEDAAYRLRRLHAEVEDQCRLNGMGSEREARLMAENEALRSQRDALLGALKSITEDDPVKAAFEGQVLIPVGDRAIRVARAAINAARSKT